MILLDTCAYLWFFSEPEAMTDDARQCVATSETLFLSLASIWEVSIKVQIGKLSLGAEVDEWVQCSLRHPKIELLPLAVGTTIYSTQLPGQFHKDPFDRAIVATAVRENLTVLTRDRRILQYPSVKSLAC